MNESTCRLRVVELYERLQRLPRRAWPNLGQLPGNGVYFFFEEGETAPLGSEVVDRIVRIGKNVSDRAFPSRLEAHYGKATRLRSVFRLHVGSALLRQANPSDRRIESWYRKRPGDFEDVEADVSARLRSDFTFCCLPCGAERHALEKALIALVAQFPIAAPSADWLGQHAQNAAVRRSGLWNDHYTGKQKYLPTADLWQQVSRLFSQASHRQE